MPTLEMRHNVSDWKVNAKLRKTLEAQFHLEMTSFWITAGSCELIVNSITETLETQNASISKSLGYWPWRK